MRAAARRALPARVRAAAGRHRSSGSARETDDEREPRVHHDSVRTADPRAARCLSP
ncbi:Hypothetical protein A7982_10752 [Minicystis rosea]|nr:Hypothetical protein A7982_10752 [Minicystis rosea]